MSEGSTAAPLPDSDDILLRLPPLPSSLPRASLVSKRWRRVLSDPQFLRRFRAFHHQQQQAPPLLGFFIDDCDAGGPYFTPTLDAPDRIPSARLSLALPRDESWRFLGCRHGLVLLLNSTCLEVTVWDPVTGDRRCVALPPGFNSVELRLSVRGGALLCDDRGDGRAPLESFKVVVLRTDDVRLDNDPHACAFLYESKAGVWSNIISTPIRACTLSGSKPSILVGNSLYWLLLGHRNGNSHSSILKFDLDRKKLTVIDTPPDRQGSNQFMSQILGMGDGGLGYAIVTGFSIKVWEKKPNSEGGAKWMLHKTVNLDKLLSLGLNARSWVVIHGHDEDGNAIFVSADEQVFMIHLKSLQFKSLFKRNIIDVYHPFTSLYTTGRGIGSGDIEADI